MKIKQFSIAFLLFTMLLVGCIPSAAQTTDAAPTEDIPALKTEVAQTVVAKITYDSALTAVAQPSATEVPPTAIPAATETSVPAEEKAAEPTNTALPIPTFTKTSAPVTVSYPTYTPTYYTDRAELSSQSPADGTVLSAGQDFDLTFTIKNVGMRSWNGNFYLKYVSGVKGQSQNGSAVTMVFVPGAVALNDTVTLTIDMVAPSQAGSYSTNWVLINDDGTGFFYPNFVFSVQ